jgi:hypothetical protein
MRTLKKLNALVIILLLSTSAFATEYYVNAATGNDANNGKSETQAWQSLAKVSNTNFKSGDIILLAKGQEFKGSIEWTNISGSKSKPIIISNYEVSGSNVKPIINAKDELGGIVLINCSHIKVDGLTIIANGGKAPKISGKGLRCGVLVTTSKAGVFQNISLNNLEVKDIFYENPNFQRGAKEVKTANGTQSYGWGIRFINNNKDALIKDVLVQSCTVSNVAHTGIKLKGKLEGLKLYDNEVFKTGGPGMQFSIVTDAHVKGNNINNSGSKDDSRKWGRGSGLWTWGVKKAVIEHNSFRNANGPADSAGCHIDFNCSDIIVQYNVSENNAGGFAEILGNNWNCAYRYNVSINDGHRVKKKGVAFQEGKIYWLSGFVGKDRKRNGPYNSYFYNNTIYVKSDIEAKMAVAKVASGVLIANNIFYIEGNSKAVLGDQYQPQEAGEATIENVIFKNNLFLKKENWPTKVLIQDEAPIFGNPQFVNAGGKEVKDYTPTNTKLIKDIGIQIPFIPKDKKGLIIGLKAEKDILGNEIDGLPDMGAIEMK